MNLLRVDLFQTWLAALLIVGSGCLIAGALLYARYETIAAGRGLTRAIVNVVAEQTTRTVQAVDQKLQLIAGQILKTNDRAAISERATDRVLRAHLKELPFVHALWVLDEQGRIAADSDVGNLGISLADREYFRTYREHPDTGFFLGAPVRSRSAGTWLIVAAYPLRDVQGRLIGVLAAALEPPYFEKLWGAINIDTGGAIDLYRRDGILMVSSSAGNPAIGLPTKDPEILSAVRGGAATADARDDAQDRLLFGRTLDSYPQLTLVAHRSLDQLLAPWRKFSLLVLAIWLAACVFVLVLYRLLRKTWTSRADAVTALSASEQKFSAAFRASPDAILITRQADGLFVEVSDAVLRITGYAREELIGRSSLALDIWCNLDDRARYVADMTSHGRVNDMQAAFRMRSGEVRIGLMSGECIEVAGQLHILGIIRDITDMKRREELIWKQANYDALTLLPNRSMFVDRLRMQIDGAQAGGAMFTLLMIDLDQFKEVNDTLGHEKGDRLLVEVARRILTCVPDEATVARLGGDEFAIILPAAVSAAQVDAALDRLIAGIRAQFMLDVDRVFVSASIGVARFPQDGSEMAELLRHADQAMYAAKQSGRNRYFHFHPGLQAAALERSTLISDLRSALQNGEFEVHYQPIVDLATGRMRKAEALLRWHHPSRGPVSPVEFIPLAESSGLILEIGDWVFGQVAAQVKRMREIADADFEISINVSPVQFHSDGQIADRWLDRLREMDVAPQAITVEITEGLLLDLTQEVDDTLRAFSNAGMKIALDDFGTGYSSLAYLRKFDIDYLKIDRSFVRNIDSNADDLVLCEAIVAMAHKLGLSVIVEGIETQRQNELMMAMGCDFGQGYLFAKPLPVR
ncbi:MAG: EAL domain-containing protein, partial [Pseudomonadota bacterium]|nr:EAL domain-containing protein [Pseudomonadota bacterium]